MLVDSVCVCVTVNAVHVLIVGFTILNKRDNNCHQSSSGPNAVTLISTFLRYYILCKTRCTEFPSNVTINYTLK